MRRLPQKNSDARRSSTVGWALFDVRHAQHGLAVTLGNTAACLSPSHAVGKQVVALQRVRWSAVSACSGAVAGLAADWLSADHGLLPFGRRLARVP